MFAGMASEAALQVAAKVAVPCVKVLLQSGERREIVDMPWSCWFARFLTPLLPLGRKLRTNLRNYAPDYKFGFSRNQIAQQKVDCVTKSRLVTLLPGLCDE
jgi:hypothetical protein